MKRCSVSTIVFLLGTTLTGGTFITSFDPDACIPEGSTVTVSCTMEDPHEGHFGTLWTGSPSIFNCSSINTITSNRIFLCHYSVCPEQHQMNEKIVQSCGSSVYADLCSIDETHYNSTLTIQNTTVAMNEGIVECHLADSLIGGVILKIEG